MIIYQHTICSINSPLGMIQCLYQLPMGSFLCIFTTRKIKGFQKFLRKIKNTIKSELFLNILKFLSQKEGILTSITNYIYRGINFAPAKKQILKISRRKAWRKYEIPFTVVQLVHIGWDSAHSCGWAMSLPPTKRSLRFVARG